MILVMFKVLRFRFEYNITLWIGACGVGWYPKNICVYLLFIPVSVQLDGSHIKVALRRPSERLSIDSLSFLDDYLYVDVII